MGYVKFDEKTDEYLKEETFQIIITFDDKELESKLYVFTEYLNDFTSLYNFFDKSYIDERSDKNRNYRDRALAYLIHCQNIYVIPINNEINLRTSKNLIEKANRTIIQGETLIQDGKKAIKKANLSIVLAIISMIVSLILSYKGLMDISNKNIKDQLNNMIKNDSCMYHKINTEQSNILQKMDSLELKMNK